MYYFYEKENISNEYDKVIKEYNDALAMPYSAGQYVKASHIFDENMSVKWNKEEVEKHNQHIKEETEQCRIKRFEALNAANEHIIDYLCKINLKQSRESITELYNYIFDLKYSDNHDIAAVVDMCEEIIEIF